MSSKNLDSEEIDDGPSNLSPSDISDQSLPLAKKRKVDELSDKHSEEDLEEGELRDDDDEDDDEDDEVENDDNKGNDNFAQEASNSKRSNHNTNNNNNNNNNSNSNLNNNNNNNDNYHRESSYGDQGSGHRGHGGGPPPHRQYYPHPNQHAPHPGYPSHNMPPNQGPPPPYMMHLQNRRQMSPNSQPPPEMMHYNHYPPNHYNHYENNSHYSNSRYPPMGEGPPMPMNYPPGPMPMNAYVRGGIPGPVGPLQKQTRCRFYSKYGNKCTWGDDCRFMHIDDSPEPVANESYPDQPGPGPNSTPPPAGNAVRQPSPGNSASVHYDRKHRLAYESAPWNEARSGAASGNVGPYATHAGAPSRYGGERPPVAPASDRPIPPALGDRPPQVPPLGDPAAMPMGRGMPAGYHSRHAYYSGRPVSDHPAAYAAGHPYNHYPPYHPSTGYPNAYRPSMGPHHSHNPNSSKYSSHPRTSMPPEARRSRSNKMGHDEDESSWSDSGSEDSILGQSSRYSHHHHHNHHSHRHPGKPNVATGSGKRPPPEAAGGAAAAIGSDEQEDLGGSGTPPGEPLPEDRQEILLSKLKEIEEAMAKKKSEQEDKAAE